MTYWKCHVLTPEGKSQYMAFTLEGTDIHAGLQQNGFTPLMVKEVTEEEYNTSVAIKKIELQ